MRVGLWVMNKLQTLLKLHLGALENSVCSTGFIILKYIKNQWIIVRIVKFMMDFTMHTSVFNLMLLKVCIT